MQRFSSALVLWLAVAPLLALASCGAELDPDEGQVAERALEATARVFFVDGIRGKDTNAGTGAAPFRTMTKGISVLHSGDTLLVSTATYREQLKVDTANVTIAAAPGHRPTLDGGYGPSLFGARGYTDYCGKPIGANDLPSPTAANQAKGNWVISGWAKTLVLLQAPGITFRGFTVRNVAGRAVGILADRCVVEDLRADFTYGGAVFVLGTGGDLVDSARVRRVTITRSSVKYFDPSRASPCSPQTGGPELVQGTLQVQRANDTVVEDCTVAFNYAEGISAAKNSNSTVVRRNMVHTNNHVHLYAVGGQNARFHDNQVYYCQNHKEVSSGDVPDGIVIGDENKTGTLPTVSGVWYNNLVVGMRRGLNVRNGSSYRTVLKGAYVGYNTFVSSGDTRFAVQIDSASGEPHTNTLVENNLVLGHASATAIAKANQPLPHVTLRHNLWSESPAAAFRGDNDLVQAPQLVDPTAAISCVYDVRSLELPDPHQSTFRAANYQLRPTSPAVGRASNRRPVNGVTPPAVTQDLFGQPRTDLGAGRFYDIGADEL